LLSFVVGGLHWHLPFHIHLPAHGAPHVDFGGHAVGGGNGETAHSNGHVISPLNPMTLAAFLAWFGGAGYLLTRYSTFWFLTGLGLASVSGTVGAAAVFLFLTKVLISHEEAMDPADYEMNGVLGRVSVPIRSGGTGEIIYSQAGTRRACGARAADGSAIAKGTEVVVTKYERGIAYVQLWSKLAGDDYLAEHPQDSGSRRT
jgi:membrane protein implicated in regulation of membrane protease activity